MNINRNQNFKKKTGGIQSKQLPTENKGTRRYKIAAAIIAVFVLHFAWQFSFIQTENLRMAKSSLLMNAPIEPPSLLEIEKIETPDAPKDAPVVAVKPDYAAKNADARRSAKSAQTAAYRKPEPPPTPKKKTVGESKTERLRRAEKMLTGF